MPPRSGRNPPIPISNTGLAAIPLDSSSIPAPERSPRRPFPPRNGSKMSPINGSTPAIPYRRGHNRSISHPFISPFSGRGKKRDKASAKYQIWDSDSDEDEVTYPLEPLSTSPRKGPSRGGPGNDLAEGRCQTCNSTVRWPRHLKVFRCTSCLMVTDLDPDTARDAKDPSDPCLDHPPPGSQPSATNSTSKVLPLSVVQTRGMIGGSLSMYFDSLLNTPRPGLSPDDNRAGRSRDARPEGPSLSAHSPSATYLSVPRADDPRARSASASSEREKFDASKENSAYLTPQTAHWQGTDTPVRTRANSDVQSKPKMDRPPDLPRHADAENKHREHRPSIFKRLENHIITTFKSCDCLNDSFSTYQPSIRSVSNGNPPRMKVDPTTALGPSLNAPVFEPDAKTLLLGDLAENSAWWMNDWAQDEGRQPTQPKEKSSPRPRMVSSRSPRMNWAELSQWYQLVLTAGTAWMEQWAAKKPDALRSEADMARCKRWESIDPSVIEREISDARVHLQRTLLKATENLLKRPRRILSKPEDTRFLFILLANPILYSPTSYASLSSNSSSHRNEKRPSNPKDTGQPMGRDGKSYKDHSASASHHGSSSHHYGLIKRILGLMSNLPNDCHHYFVSWFSRFSPGQFQRLVELIGGFLNYRLTRQHGRKRNQVSKDGDELVPSFASASGNTPAELHAAINRRSPNKQPAKKKETPMVYTEDWQIRAAARIMSLLFTANNAALSRNPDEASRAPRTSHHQGHMIPISSFYNTLLDYSDLLADFEIWESRSSKFSFCQYPFFLSIWAKIHILEHDARRQMEVKAREAFFNSILNHRAVSQYLVLKVRRECLVEDSLRGVSEVVGSGQEEIKKGLRIEFTGEEGIDAGGLRKEWFLLLVREVFDPYHGLFIYDEDSQFCYFNPHCFESSEQFFLVGVLLGLAIYNSTILDIDLPPFAFKKLLASAPQTNGPQPATSSRSSFKCTLDDLAEYRPALAKGLRGLLEFDGDVAETFCYDFVAQVDRYGKIVNVPLCPGGETRPVTNANRREFVDLYVHYLLDTAVARQFEPFKRGFFTVCGGNALSLFRPEEIELLVRGSDEALDVPSLRAVATYDNWSSARPESVPVVRWFWDFFENSPPQAQRKILSFITGSDRIPAMGATSLTIRLACFGDDSSRYPIARTCFNTLGLYRYATQEKLQKLLWDAVLNSEGFGLK